MRIVVADDVADVLTAIVLVVESIPAVEVVATAAGAADAVDAVIATHPDLAVLDVHMPGDGLTACERIVAALPATAVVMMSAVVTDEIGHEARRRGAIDFVPKGSDAESFRDRLAACVARVRDSHANPAPA